MSGIDPITNAYLDEVSALLDKQPKGQGKRVRQSAADAFALMGLPTNRLEDWRYTDLKTLRAQHYPAEEKNPPKDVREKGITDWSHLLMVNGTLQSSPSLAKGVNVYPIHEILRNPPDWASTAFEQREREGVSALNLALANNGYVIHLNKDSQLDGLEIINIANPQKGMASHCLNLVVLEEGAKAALLIRNSGQHNGWFNCQTLRVLHPKSQLDEFSSSYIQGDGINTFSEYINVGDDARFNQSSVAMGTKTLRRSIDALIGGKKAHLGLYGAQFAKEKETLDMMTRIIHAGPNATSRQLFKGIAAAQGKIAYQGRITVEESAQKIEAEQDSNNLILDRSGEINTKPELLIHADDVKCSHGATVGELDKNALFYMMQRGIPESLARDILTRAFAGDVLEPIEDETIRNYFINHVENWMENRKGKTR